MDGVGLQATIRPAIELAAVITIVGGNGDIGAAVNGEGIAAIRRHDLVAFGEANNNGAAAIGNDF
jgi:hypothetical protein